MAHAAGGNHGSSSLGRTSAITTGFASAVEAARVAVGRNPRPPDAARPAASTTDGDHRADPRLHDDRVRDDPASDEQPCAPRRRLQRGVPTGGRQRHLAGGRGRLPAAAGDGRGDGGPARCGDARPLRGAGRTAPQRLSPRRSGASRHDAAAPPVRLSVGEYRLFRMLFAARNRPVARERLAAIPLPHTDLDGQNALDATVSRLRRKIGADRIITIRGIGYQLVDSQQLPPNLSYLHDTLGALASAPS